MARPGPKPGHKRKTEQQETAASVQAPVAEASTDAEDPAEGLETASVGDAAHGPDPIADPAPVADLPVEPEAAPAPTSADRENPGKLSGQALRDLAHKRGIALSTLCFMSDEKIREQLLYINYRQYHDDEVD